MKEIYESDKMVRVIRQLKNGREVSFSVRDNVSEEDIQEIVNKIENLPELKESTC
jgi:hypothetical protein